jgi:hypothetical protein
MQALLLSGLLYLSGIAIILWLRPALMFHPGGEWKEFGIGRGGDTHTWLPFWLFAIAWAMMSYIIVFAIQGGSGSGGRANGVAMSPPTQLSSRRLRVSRPSLAPSDSVRAPPQELMPGYYMLNTPAVNETGVPRYVYIGDRLPA